MQKLNELPVRDFYLSGIVDRLPGAAGPGGLYRPPADQRNRDPEDPGGVHIGADFEIYSGIPEMGGAGQYSRLAGGLFNHGELAAEFRLPHQTRREHLSAIGPGFADHRPDRGGIPVCPGGPGQPGG